MRASFPPNLFLTRRDFLFSALFSSSGFLVGRKDWPPLMVLNGLMTCTYDPVNFAKKMVTDVSAFSLFTSLQAEEDSFSKKQHWSIWWIWQVKESSSFSQMWQPSQTAMLIHAYTGRSHSIATFFNAKMGVASLATFPIARTYVIGSKYRHGRGKNNSISPETAELQYLITSPESRKATRKCFIDQSTFRQVFFWNGTETSARWRKKLEEKKQFSTRREKQTSLD